MEVFNIYNIYIVYKNKTYTKIDQKVFSGHLVVCWPWLLVWSVRTSCLCFSCTQGTKFREISMKYRRFFGYRWRSTRYPPPIVDLMNFRAIFGEIADISTIFRVFTDFSAILPIFRLFLWGKNTSKFCSLPVLNLGQNS